MTTSADATPADAKASPKAAAAQPAVAGPAGSSKGDGDLTNVKLGEGSKIQIGYQIDPVSCTGMSSIEIRDAATDMGSRANETFI